MKVEIGESLALSWLRHVQGCVLAQLNWKPSPAWEIAGETELAQDFEAIRSFVDQGTETRIFRKVKFRQFIRQAEIDALGLHFSPDGAAPVVFAVDSAFHENGLLYVDYEETAARVLKKLVRSAFACRAFFRAQELHLVFATPKMHAAIREAVERQLADLTPWFMERWTLSPRDIRLRVIANEDFKSEILHPVLRCVNTVADTSELFLRSQQLMALCNAMSSERKIRPRRSNPERREGDEKIGARVQSALTVLVKSEHLPPEVIKNLIDAQYCKKTFNLGYPLLKRIDPQTSLSEQRKDQRGYARFWNAPITIGGEQFLVCNQWFAWQRGAFDSWVQELTGENGGGNLSPRQSLSPPDLVKRVAEAVTG